MPLLRRTTTLAFAALLTGTIAAHAWPRDASSAARIPAKTARIHAHFDSALAGLRARDVSQLTSEQRVRRTALIATLRAYDARGAFPNNYDFPEQPTPYFVDRKTGVRCAVAHLLESTGRGDIVDRVSASGNNVRAAALAGDTAFTAWLGANGLTLAEAAGIQPAYEGDRGGVGVGTVVAVVGGSLLAVGSSVGTSVWNTTGNADGHSRFGNVFGVVSGVLTTVVGASIAGSREGNAERAGGVATAAIGGVSVALGLRGSARRSRTMTERREAERMRDGTSGARQASIVPIVGMGRNPTAGVAMRIRF